MKYPDLESTTLELKEKNPSKNQIVKTIIGFCNQFGGRLVIGVSDDGTILGVPEENMNEQIDSCHESIIKSCTPTIIPTIYMQGFGNKHVIIIEVSAGMNKPYFLTTEGESKGTYLRLGTHTVRASAGMIQELHWQNKGFSADEMPIYHASIQDISEQKFLGFLQTRRHGLVSSAGETKLWKHYRLIIEEHGRSYPTTAAILLFGSNTLRFLKEAFIICTHFNGVSGREVIATKDCIGNLFEQLNESMNFITTRLNKSFTIKDTKRQEHLEIPLEAIREVVINAIVHRDYQIEGPIKIAIFDDRIEIFSPGNFPGPLQLDQLEMGITYIRNSVICRIFREAGYIEKLGSGFLTLFNSYRQYQLPVPVVHENSGFVKCILPRPYQIMSIQKIVLTHKEDEREKQIQRLLYLSGQITIQDVIKECQISRQTAVRVLNQMIRQGFLKRLGKGRSVKYVKD